ncbi:MAG: leucyl/phenylalanyl-tRNA--protein transferase [Pseudomonadota bacterium]
MSDRFDTTDLLNCYRRGVFPMADSREDMRLFLMDPDLRGILPLDRFHVPKRLRKTVRQDPFRVTVDTAFNRVIEACAEPHPTRPATWINDPILNLYGALHRQGFAHSVECWTEDDDLVGGLYGVALGGAFFGESMFSRATDASKIALVHLVARLKLGGFELLDAQFHNPHLEQFGLEEISRDDFRAKLWRALRVNADFYSAGSRGLSTAGSTSLQAITHIS